MRRVAPEAKPLPVNGAAGTPQDDREGKGMSEKALRTRAERRLWNARWLAAMFFSLAMLLGLLTYERGHALVQGYGAALAFGLIGICLYRGEYHADRVYGLGLVFAAWYVLTRALNGDHYLQYDYNQYQGRSISQRQLRLHIRSAGRYHIQVIGQCHTLI